MQGTTQSIPAQVDPLSQVAATSAWSDAWRTALHGWGPRAAAIWLAIVTALALLAPLLSNGHPLIETKLDAAGTATSTTSPLLRHLTRLDVALLVPAVLLPFAWLVARHNPRRTLAALTTLVVVTTLAAALHSSPPALVTFHRYAADAAAGTARQTYTLNPWSPGQREADHALVPPGTRTERATFLLGSDGLGEDVLAQLIHGCRLAISIGLVSTGIALLIGVTLGAIMGYFGGWVDAALMRIVEVFMGVPLVFLLITAAAVLPRNTYLLMAIIGCCSWTGAARFTRAEFMKLRELDFVHAARAAGLPTRSIIFRHMLPSGVTPVLVDASFAIAAAILAEATLSFLGLGPPGQASWGRLLSDALGSTGGFVWWLAIFPGAAIFLTVLSYNVLGESLRQAMDPRERLKAEG